MEQLSILEWGWYDPDGFLVDGELALPGASERNVADYETVLSMLPTAIDCEHGQIAVTWQCVDYPAEGAWEGEYSFVAVLPEGYVMAEGAAPLTVKVILGGGFYFDEPEGEKLPLYIFLVTPNSDPTPEGDGYVNHPKYTQGSGLAAPKASKIDKYGIREGLSSEEALSYVDSVPGGVDALQDFGTVRYLSTQYTSDEYEIVWYAVSKKDGWSGSDFKCTCSGMRNKYHIHLDGILQKKVSPAALNLTKRIDKAQSATETFTFTLRKLQQSDETPIAAYDESFTPIQMTATIAPGATEAPITSASGNIVPFGFYEVKENLNDNPKWDATSVEITSGSSTKRTDSPAIYLSVASNGTLKFSSTATGSYNTATKITLCNVIQKYTVKYDWGTAPASVTLPTGESDLAYGDSYTVDSKYTKGYEVEGTNAEGKSGKWVFSGWDQTGTIIILDEPIIKGQWTFEDDHYTITYTDGVELATPIFRDQVYEAHIWADGRVENVHAFEGADPERSGFEFMGWLYIGENDQHKGNIYTTAEAAMLDVTENIVFAAQWKPLYTGTVRLIPDNSTVSTLTAAQIFGSGSAIWLRPTGSTAEDAYIQMTESLENGKTVYTSVLEQGIYDIFYSGPDGEKHQYLAPAGNTRNLTISPAISENYHNINYFSVTYNLNGGSLSVTLPQQYYIVGSNVNVTTEAPAQAGYVFTGWAYERAAASPDFLAENSTAGRSVITYLNAPVTLYAQWHKETWAKVHLELEIDTKGTGEYADANPDGAINTVLAYRERGTTTYYEYNPVQKTIDNWYTAPASGTVVTLVYDNWFGEDPALSADYDYSVNVSLHSYEVIDRTVSERALGEDGFYHYNVKVTLRYNPSLFHLEYTAVADDALMKMSDRIPDAVDLKISVWNPVEDQWEYIQAHQGDNTTDIEITNGSGSGSYHVPYGDQDTTYYFRVEVMGFTVGSTELGATDTGDKINYASTAVGNYGAGQYTAVVTVNGGQAPESATTLPGAYSTDGSAQKGEILVTISYHPYNVVFVDNDEVDGEKIEPLTDVLNIPNINAAEFQPTRSGYRFAGWFYDEEFTKPAVSNAVISADMVTKDSEGNLNVYLYAKWLSNIEVSGEVRVPTNFSHYEHDRPKTVTVTLHRTTGTNPDVNAVTVDVEYGADGIGVASYKFADLPDLSLHGSNYRINVLATNFETTYQNEADSLVESFKKDASKYNAADFTAVNSDDNTVYTVNAWLRFEPEVFSLSYELDSTAVGEAYRDMSAEIRVTCDDGTRSIPSTWPVITQMQSGGTVHQLSEGKASGEYPVWQGHTDGELYSYGINFASYALPGAQDRTPYTPDDAYISVSYVDPAKYRAEPLNGLHQNQLLRAIITPKSYPVVYNLGSGASEIITGMGDARFKDVGVYEGKHTWSYETTLPVPVRAGYEFLGWYGNQAFTGEKLSSIAASVTYTDDESKTIPLYAKWLPCEDTVDVKVTLIHKATDGVSVAQNYGRNMQIVLTASDKSLTQPEYIPVEGQQRIDVLGNVWHDGNRTDERDEFQYSSYYYGINPFTGLPSDKLYSANVYMEHYTVTNRQVTPTRVEVNGQLTDSTHYLVELTLQFNPDDFFFTFQTEMEKDTEGRVKAPEALWPRSAEFKVTCWYTNDESPARWQAITQHENSVVEVMLNADGSGQGGYSVWNHVEGTTPYYYRMELVSLTLQDGTVVPMSGSDHVTYIGGENYSAVIEADENCLDPSSTGLKGAYAAQIEDSESYAQAGALKAIISVKAYDVTLNANGGKLMVDGQEQDSYTYSQQVRMPDISGHVPVKTGHSFTVWTLPNASVPNAGDWLNGHLELSANYTPNKYPINYHTDGGTTPDGPSFYIYDAAKPVSIAGAQTKTGYVFMGWYNNADFSGEPVTEIPAGSTGPKDFYALWEKDEIGGDGIPDKYQILVRYVADANGYVRDGEGVAIDAIEEKITLKDGENPVEHARVTAAGAEAQANGGYAFDRWTWDDTISSLSFAEGKNAQSNPSGALSFDAVGGSTYTFYANFDTDVKGDGEVGDGIPDKYQILIRYEVENGTWVNGTAWSFYLTKKDADGNNSETGAACLADSQIPKAGTDGADMIADAGHGNTGGWRGHVPNTTRPLTADQTYRYAFDAEFFNVTFPDVDKPTVENNAPGTGIVSVQKDRYIRVDPNGGTLDSSTEVRDIEIESDVTLVAPTWDKHVFIGYKRTEGPVENDSKDIAQIFTAQWLEDNNGDTVPDKYQATVEYRSAGNGTVSPASELYTFMDANGRWLEGGTLMAKGSTAAPAAPTVDMIYCFDYWENEHSASFDVSEAATSAFEIPNAKGGSTYSFTAHFAVDRLYDGDRAGGEDSGAFDAEHKGDGIPDYKQFVIYYRPYDDSHGNVDFTTSGPGTNHVAEVFTLNAKTEDVTPRVVNTFPAQGYAFDYWAVASKPDNPIWPFVEQPAEQGGVRTYRAHFDTDVKGGGEGGDTIPDKYQTKITYVIQGGSWTANTADTANKEEWYTLYERSAETNLWVKLENVTLGDRIPDISLAEPDASQHLAKPGHWDVTPAADTPVTGTATYTYTFSDLIKHSITVTVTNGSFDADDNPATVEESPLYVEHGKNISLSFKPDTGDTGYALQALKVDGQDLNASAYSNNLTYSFNNVDENHSIEVVYSTDEWNDEDDLEEGGDGIADSRQVKFSFVSESEAKGTVTGATVQIITLREGDNTAAPEEVTVTANDGWKFDKWLDEEGSETKPFEVRAVTGGAEYVYTATFTKDKATVSYPDADKDVDKNNKPDDGEAEVQKTLYIEVRPNGGTWRGSSIDQLVLVMGDIDLSPDPVKADCAFEGWNRTDGRTTDDGKTIAYVFTAKWSSDLWSDEDDGPGSDGIPDRFQIKVNYSPVPEEFGQVSSQCEVHTLTDGNGGYLSSGTVQLEGSTATAIEIADPKDGKNSFVNWTDTVKKPAEGESIIPVGDDALLKLSITAEGGKEYNYYANFRHEMMPAAMYLTEHYLYSDTAKAYVLDEDETVVSFGTVGEKVKAEVKKIDGYALNESLSVTEGIVTMPESNAKTRAVEGFLTLKLYYDIDAGGSDGSKPDGVPDIYQKKITFSVINGIWGDGLGSEPITVWVTLYDEQGNPSPLGKGTLTAPTGMRPFHGYGGGYWDKIPPTVVYGTNPDSYTFWFTRLFVPITGDESDLGLWSALAAMSLMSAATAALRLKRKKEN